MRTIEYYQYTLVSSHIPEVVNNQIIKGIHYGGIKLVYTKQKIRQKEIINIRNFRIFIPIKKFPSHEVTFLRPFKHIWNVKDNWLTPNNYGKPKSPYTNIWCELSNGNYDNIAVACTINVLVIRILHRITDKTIINHIKSLSNFKHYE
jgi:hypothetical protein